jgi:hypothetical protein
VLCIAQAMLGDGAHALSQSGWPRARASSESGAVTQVRGQ